jgi:hypothetical protein
MLSLKDYVNLKIQSQHEIIFTLLVCLKMKQALAIRNTLMHDPTCKDGNI